MPRVLVTDGEQRSALAVVRSLGAAGHDLFVAAHRSPSLAGSSRHCRQDFLLPDPLLHPAGYAARLAELVDRYGVDVLLPISEGSLLAVLPRRNLFANTNIPFPEIERFQAICDKARVMEAARRVGLAVPSQVRLERPADADGLAGQLRFPVVVKPARSIGGEESNRVKSSVIHAETPDLLHRALLSLDEAVFPVLVQERIVGPGVGIFVLVEGGKLVAAFAHRRIREKPPAGGVSVDRESVPLDPSLLALSLELLDAFQWSGVAMVEYKQDERTGTAYIMEINGRFWGSLQLAIDAGVDFPRLLVEGHDGPPVTDYRTGVRSRWEWGEVDHLVARLLRSRDRLSLPPSAPGRARAVLDFLTGWGAGTSREVFRWNDPAPFVRESADWFRKR